MVNETFSVFYKNKSKRFATCLSFMSPDRSSALELFFTNCRKVISTINNPAVTVRLWIGIGADPNLIRETAHQPDVIHTDTHESETGI